VTLQRFFAPKLARRAGGVRVARAKAFEAAHAYRDPSFGEAGRLHGHNYVVTATIGGSIDPSTHFLVDFRDLDALLKEVTVPLDHHRLDVEYAGLQGREASAESLAVALFADLAPRLGRAMPAAHLDTLRLAETEELWADTNGDDDVELTRAYSFSAAHRLADPARSDKDNRQIYGKCANVQPHGHDYRFEVTVRGPLDPRTSTVTDLGALDRAVESEIVARFDHRYLNVEVEPFQTLIPTAERIAERIWTLLAPVVPRLARIVVYETPRSAFTYEGPVA
jgi:6-pyruvoyltetrahydropterin/6-carboxytetrahydropterin synthase